MLNAYDKRLVELAPKAERLVRHHRNNIFDDDDTIADRHCRTLRRLRRTATWRALVERRVDAEAHRKSERLLSMYA
jgi:hypothetical protein